MTFHSFLYVYQRVTSMAFASPSRFPWPFDLVWPVAGPMPPALDSSTAHYLHLGRWAAAHHVASAPWAKLQEIQKEVSWNGRCLQNGKIVLILYNMICIRIYDYNHIHHQEKWWYVVGLVQVKCSANIMVFTCDFLINKCRGSLPSVLQTDALTLRWHHEMPVVWGDTVTVTFAWVWML